MDIKKIYAIDGLDRLGKSTLIEGIQNKLGHYQVIHFSKPAKLEVFKGSTIPEKWRIDHNDGQLFNYQRSSFVNSMLMTNTSVRLIFDRWHLGEAVYSNLYRGYNGEYVFELEKYHNLHLNTNIRLILLTEDFGKSDHFVDDGLSFNIHNRKAEQEMFIEAFHKSTIPDKRIVCVTDDNGKFKSKESILKEVLE